MAMGAGKVAHDGKGGHDGMTRTAMAAVAQLIAWRCLSEEASPSNGKHNTSHQTVQ